MDSVCVCLTVIIFLVLVKAFFKISAGRCKSNTCLIGKTVIVTGGNSGIGFRVSLALAARGCRLIIADKDDAEQSKQTIIERTGNSNVVTKHLNLASYKSIRLFAKDINESEDRLDVLINNAGSGLFNCVKTEDGCNLGMQVNHFGSFLLSHLLVDLLKKSAPSRIIFTSSYLSFLNNLTVKNLNTPNFHFIYANSKVCNIITSQGFAEKLKGTGVTSNSHHPGLVNTDIFRKVDSCKVDRGLTFELILDLFYSVVMKYYGKSVEEGAQTTIHLAVSQREQNTTGAFFSDCKSFPHPRKALDKEFCAKIWEKSEHYVQLLPEEKL